MPHRPLVSLLALVLVATACRVVPVETPDAGTPSRTPGIAVLAGSIDGPGNVDGPRLSARFGLPTSVAKGWDGDLFVVDKADGVVRRIDAQGNVTLFAGKSRADGTNDGPRLDARFSSPSAVVFAHDALFVADAGNSTIRRIAKDGTVSTFAGTPRAQGIDDGKGAAARFRSPEGLAVDGQGRLLVADAGAHTIRRIDTDGTVTTVVGLGDTMGTDDGTGTDARLSSPYALAVAEDGTVAIADADNHAIRLMNSAGEVSTLAGDPAFGQDHADGTGQDAHFSGPRGVAFLADGALLVADTFGDRLRHVTRAGVVTTWGAGNGSDDGTKAEARYQFPWGLLVDGGAVYVCDAANGMLRKIEGDSVTRFAGRPTRYGSTDGVGEAARFFNPTGMLVREDGSILVADTNNHTLRAVAADGTTTTFAGHPDEPNTVDGTLAEARFEEPAGLVTDGAGGFFVSDLASSLIRHVKADGTVETYAGGPSRGGAFDDGPLLDARFSAPAGLARDRDGNVFVADVRNHAIRRIGTDGNVTTIAGDGLPGWNDGSGPTARFQSPQSIAIDANGVLFVADMQNHTIRRVAFESGVWQVSTFAGMVPSDDFGPIPGFQDGTGFAARFDTPTGVAVDDAGNVLVADLGNSLIRRIAPDRAVTTIVGTPGSYGIVPGALPGVLFEPHAFAPLGDGKWAVTFNTGVLVVTTE